MLLRVFTLKFDSTLAAFDDRGLRDFVKDKEVLSVRDHFFARDGLPYLAVIVTYNLLHPEEARKTVPEKTEEKDENREKWRQFLEEADWPLFNTLRDWRNGLARKEGVPPYVICSNRQLAQIAHRRPDTLQKLAAVEGMGKVKLERYGAALLQAVGSAPEEETDEDAGTNPS